MKGDFTRRTFDPGGRYAGVRMQQGRALLDADWNEQLDIQQRRDDRAATEAIGRAGVPWSIADAFKVVVTGGGTGLGLHGGRAHLGGIPCVLDAPTNSPLNLAAQPDLQAPLPSTDGTWVAYLDAWRHHVTALEDPALREPALAGADTTTRDRVVWQVRFLPESPMTPPISFPEAYVAGRLHRRPDQLGTLAARAKPGESFSSDACMTPLSGGYKRLENALYRVEVHQGSEGGAPTFKWSRENAAVVARCAASAVMDTAQRLRLTVSGLGRNELLAFQINDPVELHTDAREVAGLPGQFATVIGLDPDEQRLDVELPVGVGEPSWFANPAGGAREVRKVRRWDAAPQPITHQTGETYYEFSSAGSGGDGIEIQFHALNGATPLHFHTGDYWLIEARAGEATIAWPRDGGNPAHARPHGVAHHYAPLAILTRSSAAWAVTQDYREALRFPALTELRQLVYLGEALPTAEPDAFDLKVGVAEGQWMVAGASVTFTPTAGESQVWSGTEWVGTPVTERTGSDGTATLRARVQGASDIGVVRARLFPKTLEAPVAAPVHFMLRRGASQSPLPMQENLLLDLDAEHVDTNQAGVVTKWASRVDPAHAAMPVNIAPRVVTGETFRGPVVRFGETDLDALEISDALNLLDKSQLSIYVVGLSESSGGTAVGRYIDKTLPCRWALGAKPADKPEIYHNGAPTNFLPIVPRTWEVASIWSHVSKNNTVSCDGRPYPSGTKYVGGNEDLTYATNDGVLRVGDGPFDLARVLVYHGAHTDAQERAVLAHLAHRYDLRLGR